LVDNQNRADDQRLGAFSEALKVAREWTPLLDLTISEFMKMRKNE
jgi:hypothetical protein